MKKRNQQLALILLALVAGNLVFAFFGGKSSGGATNAEQFVLADTALVSTVSLSGPLGKIELTRTTSGWLLNDTYPVDDRLRKLLFSIMQRVRVRKEADYVSEEQVAVRFSGGPEFLVWGNPMRTRTYFSPKGGDEIYEMEIPGYSDYLGSIFTLHPDQWRDRLLLNGTWRTIQSLKLRVGDSEELDIRFANDFFEVKGVTALDSNAVVGYLNQFEYFQVNEWVSPGRFARYDSLVNTAPLATLQMQLISRKEPYKLRIFRALPGEGIHLVALEAGEMLVVDQRRVGSMLARREEFRYKP